MKGAVGFLVGIIGFCFFAAVSILPPILVRGEGPVMVLIMSIVAFTFLNVLVIGFYRMIGGLHDTVLYPDDPYSHPLRGRGLFLTGYIGLLAVLVCTVCFALMQSSPAFRIRGRDLEIVLFFIAWFFGWGFTGCMLGGVLMLLHDIHHKAFYRTMAHRDDNRYGDDFDISRRESRRRPREADEERERPRQRQWEE